MISIPDLPKALDTGLRNKLDDRNNSVLHVSDLSVALSDGNCPRALWLRLRGAAKRPLTAGMLLLFDHGHRIHERLIEVLEIGLVDGWHIQNVEQKIELPGPVYGRYDALLKGAKGERIIVDFKTIRGRAFGYLTEAKPSNVLQVQGYIKGADVDSGLVFYVDREGQNQARQFSVERDDDAVRSATSFAMEIRDRECAPDILQPKLDIGKNKGPDSVKLRMPWQCSYCQYIDVSCPGALAKNLRELGIIGYIDGDFAPKKEFGKLAELVESLRDDVIPF